MPRYCLVALVVGMLSVPAPGEYAVEVELESLSPQAKTDWPVVVNVWQVLGRNIPPGALKADGFHVVGAGGRELPWNLEKIPPYDLLSNDELVFLLPSMKPGEKITVRVTNTDTPSSARKKIDVVGSRHNLIANGGFEAGRDGRPDGWSGHCRLDEQVKRSGGSALLVAGDSARRARHAAKIPLHPGSLYYAGVWCKTRRVARHGLAAGNGAYFDFQAEGEKGSGFRQLTGYTGVRIAKQCGTRDWNKSRWWSRYAMDFDDWGVHRNTVQAAAKATRLALVLDQRKQFVLEGDYNGQWWLDDFVLMEQPNVTVRFAKSVEPLMTGGVFLFTRPVSSALGYVARQSHKTPNFCSFPFAHEAVRGLDGFALRGQRVPYLLGIYHTRPIRGVSVRLAGGALTGPDGAGLAPESVEFSEGFYRPRKTWLLRPADGPVNFHGETGVRYFVVTFLPGRGTTPGRYAGTLEVAIDGKPLRSVPLTLRVQDLALPEVDDVYVGYIFQGTKLLTKEGLALYARSGFTSLTVFGGFLPYRKRDDGHSEIDLDELDEKMKWLSAGGIKAVCLYSEVELDPQWGPGRLFRKSGGTKATYQREIRRLAAAAKAHPDWPRIIYMIWDEPAGHGGIQPKLAWVNEVAPEAWTTLDVEFSNLPKAIRYVNTPCLDNPADCTGPELYAWIRKQGKRFGYCGKAMNGEVTRYQMGLWMIASGAVLQQPWHLQNHKIMDLLDGRPARSIGAVSCGRGTDDLRMYKLLAGAIREAKAADNRAGEVAAAERYLEGIFSVWQGDTAHVSMLMPYLGWASTWGYERFYDDWQEQMAHHAASIKGVKWVD